MGIKIIKIDKDRLEVLKRVIKQNEYILKQNAEIVSKMCKPTYWHKPKKQDFNISKDLTRKLEAL